MAIGAVLRIASLGARGLKTAGRAVFTGKGVPGGLVGQKALEYGLVIPALGSVAGAAGLPFGYSKPAPAPGPAAGGMSQQQMDFMYGRQGFSWPWQGQEAFLDRQLRTQKEMFSQGQDTLRYTAGLNYNLGTQAQQVQRELGSKSLDTQQRIADLYSGRQLEGLRDTNRTRVALADRELYGLRDTNRSRVKLADIGARRDMYLADRGVEVARWQGSPMRIATFGSLMR